MWFTSPRMIRGWFTESPSWHGRAGTRIPEFGTAARTSRSEPASESAFSEDMDGAGLIGDSIGITERNFNNTGTTPGATRFITGALLPRRRRARWSFRPWQHQSRGGAGGGVYNRPGATTRPFGGNTQAARGYAAPRGQSGVRSGTFSDYDQGGQVRSYSSRGNSSVGGGEAAWRWRGAAGGGGGGGGSWRRR